MGNLWLFHTTAHLKEDKFSAKVYYSTIKNKVFWFGPETEIKIKNLKPGTETKWNIPNFFVQSQYGQSHSE